MALSRNVWREDPWGTLADRDPFSDFFSSTTGTYTLLLLVNIRRRRSFLLLLHPPTHSPIHPPTHPSTTTGGWLTPFGGMGSALARPGQQALVPALNLDVKETASDFQISVDAPGMKKEGR